MSNYVKINEEEEIILTFAGLKNLNMLNDQQENIIGQIASARNKLEKAQVEHASIKADVHLGPMDYITPWTATGSEISYQKKKITELELELGRSIAKERLG